MTLTPHLAYLTEPATGQPVLNIQLRPGEVWPHASFVRLELSQRQLASILVDGTAMALRSEGGRLSAEAGA